MITKRMSKEIRPRYFWIGVVAVFFFMAAIGFTSIVGHASEIAGGPIASTAPPIKTVTPCGEGISTMVGMSSVPAQANEEKEIRIADHLQTCTEVCKEQCGTNSLGELVCTTTCIWKCVGQSKGHGDPRKKEE